MLHAKQIDTLLLLCVLRLVSQPLPKHFAPPLHTPLPLGRFARYPTSRSSSAILATTSDAILFPLLQLTAVPDSPSHWFSLEHYYLVGFGFGRAHRSSPCMHVPPKWYLRIYTEAFVHQRICISATSLFGIPTVQLLPAPTTQTNPMYI